MYNLILTVQHQLREAQCTRTALSTEKGQVQNLSCDNEFHLHNNHKSFLFHSKDLGIYPRFKIEAWIKDGLYVIPYVISLKSLTLNQIYFLVRVDHHVLQQVIFILRSFPLSFQLSRINSSRNACYAGYRHIRPIVSWVSGGLLGYGLSFGLWGSEYFYKPVYPIVYFTKW